jgi:hypothetical protein
MQQASTTIWILCFPANDFSPPGNKKVDG